MKIMTVLTGSLLSLSALAFNPGEYNGVEMQIFAKEGHGGKAVVCRDENSNKIISSEIQDFFESRVIWGRDLVKIDSSLNSDQVVLEKIIPKISSILHHSNTKEIQTLIHTHRAQKLFDKIRFIDGGRLKPVPDSLEVTLPKNCKLEQAAVYYDRNLTLIDKEIWDSFDVTNKVGILTHEYFYFFLRGHGETDSLRTRKFLGKLFSSENITPVFEGMSSTNDGSNCVVDYSKGNLSQKDLAKTTSYYELKSEEGVFIYLEKIFGELVLSRKRIFVRSEYWPEDWLINSISSSSALKNERLTTTTNWDFRISFIEEIESDIEGGDLFFGTSYGKYIDGKEKVKMFLFGYQDPDRQIEVSADDQKVMCSTASSTPIPIEDPSPSPIDPPVSKVNYSKR